MVCRRPFYIWRILYKKALLNDTIDNYTFRLWQTLSAGKPLPLLRSSMGLAASCSRWSCRLSLHVNNKNQQ
jgi:hypothetical protein